MSFLTGAAAAIFWFLLLACLILALLYRRARLWLFTLCMAGAVVAHAILCMPSTWTTALLALPVLLLALLNLKPLRIGLISRPFLKKYLKLLPTMSSTEREALEAGTVWWDGELFSGGPNWPMLMNAKAPALSAEEKAFLDGPCETLCQMLDAPSRSP